MIKRRIVLILGAGASIPFGFPSGRELRDKIIAGLRKDTAQFFQLLHAAGYDVQHITNFRDALLKSGRPSVDVFLEHRPEFIPVGKVAIAASLIPYEDETKLWGGPDNWYEHLWDRLGPKLLDDVAQSQLSVITFNYDRSLEHYLFSALRNAYNIGTDEAARYLRDGIKIIHVHGKLGELPYAGGAVTRSYQPGDPSNLKDAAVGAAKTIKIVHEGTRDDAEFVQARQLLAQAEIVCFLGFGFLKANVERLEITNLSSGVAIFGTCYGLMQGEQSLANGLVASRMRFGDPGQGVLAFLRHHGVLQL